MEPWLVELSIWVCGYVTGIILVFVVGEHWNVWRYPDNRTPGAALREIALRVKLSMLRSTTQFWDSLMALVPRPTTHHRPANRAGAASLSSLPPELLEIVGEHLRSADMRALRLVSRDLAEKVLATTFTRVHFGKRSCMMYSLASLDTLLCIAQHPVFSHALQELTFFVDTDHREREHLQRIYEDQQKRDDQVATLRAAFQRLQCYDELRQTAIASLGIASRQKMMGRGDQLSNTKTALRRLEVALGVLPAKCFRTLSTLVMEGDMVYVCTKDIDYYAQTAASQSDMFKTNIFEYMSSLTLHLQASNSYGDDSFAYLLGSLSSNRVLESLDLYFKPLTGSGAHLIDNISDLTLLPFPSLETLTVRGFKAPLTDLRDFVQRNSKLRKMALVEYITIGLRAWDSDDFETWEDAINDGADAVAMIKDAIGIHELEHRLTKGVVLYRSFR